MWYSQSCGIHSVMLFWHQYYSALKWQNTYLHMVKIKSIKYGAYKGSYYSISHFTFNIHNMYNIQYRGLRVRI